MQYEAIVHRSSEEFIYPVSRSSLKIRLLAKRQDLVSCEICYWNRYTNLLKTQPLRVVYRDAYHDDFRTRLDFNGVARFMRYYFKLTDTNGQVCFFNEYGFTGEPQKNGFFEHHYTNENEVIRRPDWAKGIIYYQIFPERFARGINQKSRHPYVDWNSRPALDNYFGGDLPGIIQKLDYLANLGIECIYLNPIFLADCNHKYATIDYFSVDPDFGTNDDLIRLVKKAHDLGIRVILDGVFNHCGNNFPPFVDFRMNGKASPYADWFLPTDFNAEGTLSRYEGFGDLSLMPKLRTGTPAVREMILKVMTYWVETAGIDGWRMDVADEVETQSWQVICAAFKHLYPDKLLLAETWTDANRLISYGDRFDCAMNYAFRDALSDFFAKRRIDSFGFDHRINHLLSKYNEEVTPLMYNLIDSHDTPRFLTESGEDKRRLKLAVVFQMTCLGSPAIYYGDEIGMEGNDDPDCRGGMKWDPKDQDHDLLSFYKTLISLRKREKALKSGRYVSILCEPNGIYGFQRKHENETVYVIINNSDKEIAVELPVNIPFHPFRDLINHELFESIPLSEDDKIWNNDIAVQNGKIRMKLPAMGFRILK